MTLIMLWTNCITVYNSVSCTKFISCFWRVRKRRLKMHLLVLSIYLLNNWKNTGKIFLNLVLGLLLNLLTYANFGLKLDNTGHFAKRPTQMCGCMSSIPCYLFIGTKIFQVTEKNNTKILWRPGHFSGSLTFLR